MKRSKHRLFTALTAVIFISGGMAGAFVPAFAIPSDSNTVRLNDGDKVPHLDITEGVYRRMTSQQKEDYEFGYAMAKKNPAFSFQKWQQMSQGEKEKIKYETRLRSSYEQQMNETLWEKDFNEVPQNVIDYLIKNKVYDTGGGYTEHQYFSGAFSEMDIRHTNVPEPPPGVKKWLSTNLPEAISRGEGKQTITGEKLKEYVLNYERVQVLDEFIQDWSVARAGTNEALLAQLNAHPGTYATILKAVGSLDINKVRDYINAQLNIAEDDFDQAAIKVSVFRQQQTKQGGTWDQGTKLVDGNNKSLKKFGDDFNKLMSKIAEAEALIRARIAARQPLDLTNGDIYTVLAFENIYPLGYDPSTGGRVTATGDLYGRTPSSAGNSLSSGGMSLSSIGWSLSSAGLSLSSAGSAGLPGQGDPYFRVSAGDTRTMYSSYAARALAETNPDLAMLMYGPLWSMGNKSPYADFYNDVPNRSLYLTRYDHDGTLSALTDPGTLAGFMDQENAARLIAAGDVQGLGRLLAQPFNVLVTWGSQLYDLDLHMTGPGVDDPANRFHIYYSARGDQLSAPYAELIKDCICYSGSEVMLTTQLQKGGVYRISAFNFGNQSTSSTELSSTGDVVLQIVRGGQAVSQGSGTTIVGGKTIFKGSPKTGQAGNTWTAVEIDPKNGGIYFVDKITSTSGSQNVQ